MDDFLTRLKNLVFPAQAQLEKAAKYGQPTPVPSTPKSEGMPTLADIVKQRVADGTIAAKQKKDIKKVLKKSNPLLERTMVK